MRQIADLHIHSRYSRACSPQLTLANIEKSCRIKGIDIIASGDFTYPLWFNSLKSELEEIDGKGLYRLKNSPVSPIKFLLSTEISLIYKEGEKVRRLHLVLHAPNLKAVEELRGWLIKKQCNISSDGRPILGLRAKELIGLCLNIHPHFLIYPAHIWTPWFAVFGSKSGFDSLEECFGEKTEFIYGYETGLSSDPEMNWRLSALDRLTLLSNSDAHSPANIGREANVFELTETSYEEIYQAIKNKDLKKIKYTIEFYPEEGMYHFDGHRVCRVSFSPAETKKHKGLCPVCGKPLTIGVMNRVEELADRPAGFRPPEIYGFRKLVELDKIIAEALAVKSRGSIRVQKEYGDLIKLGGSEMAILLDLPLEKIKEIALPEIAEGIRRVREGELLIEPGFDGEYGRVRIFQENELKKAKQPGMI